jgi:hypothetical protein
MKILRDLNAINAMLVKDGSRDWTEAKNRFAIDEENSFGIAHSIADQILGTTICKMSFRESDGSEFINAQVHMTCVLPNGRILDDNVRIDSDMNLLPSFGYKGRFSDLLPYIVKDSIEYRSFKPSGEGKTKSSRLFWKWNTERIAASDCPLKLDDVSAKRAELQAEYAEQSGDDNSDNFVAVEVDEEILAMFA